MIIMYIIPESRLKPALCIMYIQVQADGQLCIIMCVCIIYAVCVVHVYIVNSDSSIKFTLAVCSVCIWHMCPSSCMYIHVIL